MPDPIEFNIDEVVALDPNDTTTFTPEHKQFLEEHKDELTTDELIKFGFEVSHKKPDPVTPPVTPTPDPKKKEGEEETPDEDEERINKAIDKKLTPIQEENAKLQAKIDIDGFISSNPDYAKYRTSITEYKSHPNYRNVPVHELAKMIAADDLMKIGARKEREAQKNADATKNRGNSQRTPAGAGKDWSTASKEDFAAKRAEILGQGQ